LSILLRSFTSLSTYSSHHKKSPCTILAQGDLSFFKISYGLVAIVVWLVRTVCLNTNIGSLLFAEFCQLGTNLREVQTGHFFIQMLWQDIDPRSVFLPVIPKIYLRQYLISKGVRHHK